MTTSHKTKGIVLPTRVLLTSFAIFVAIFIMFLHSHEINNYFDVRPYFSFEIVLPALGAMTAAIIIQRFVDHKFMLGVLTWAAVVLLLLFGFKSATFETFNGDDVMYIAGYMIVYEQVLFMILVATIACLMYMAVILLLDELRNNELKLRSLIRNGMVDLVLFSIEVIIFLAIATRVSFGVAIIVMAGTLVASNIFNKSFALKPSQNNQVPENAAGTGHEHARALDKVQSHSRAKNFFMMVQTVFIGILTGYLWPNDFAWTGEFEGQPGSHLTSLNARLLLEEALFTMIVLSIVTFIIAVLFARSLLRPLSKIKNLEGVLVLATNVLLWAWLGLMYAGTAILGVRISNIIAPWVIITYASVIVVFSARRKRTSPGVLGAILAVMIAGTWLGSVFGKNGELDEYEYIFPIVLAACTVIWALVYGYATRVILEPDPRHHQEPDSAGAHLETKDTRAITPALCASITNVVTRAVERNPRAVRTALLLCAFVLPMVLVAMPATSTDNFQLLANVDNQCIFFLADPTTRIDKDYRTRFGLSTFTDVNPVIQIHAARNERESIQVVMQPVNQKHYSIYNIVFSGFRNFTGHLHINASEFVAYRARPVEELANIVPDVLEPFSPFAVSDGSAVPLWMTFHVPDGVPAGDYTGTITLHVDDKNREWGVPEAVDLSIQLHVFNFTLPAIPSLKSAFGIADSNDVPNLLPLFKEYRMMYWSPGAPLPTCTLHANGSVTSMNFTATDAFIEQLHAAGTYWTRFHFFPRSGYLRQILPPNFTVGGIEYTNASYIGAPEVNATLREYLQLFAGYYKTVKNYTNDFGETVPWFNDMYINGHDEIDGPGGAYKANALVDYRYLADLDCPFPLMQTVGGYEEDTFSVLESLPRSIICWHTGGYEQDHVMNWKASGREAWIYTTRGPRFPSPSLSTSGFATQVRALGWQCFIYNYSTYLIWDVLTPGNARQGHAYQGWSGGTAFYKEWGTYARSTRVELIREGFEDHDYFYLLSRMPDSPQKALLLQRIDLLMSGFQPDMDYRHFQQLRVEIGSLLSL